MKLASRHFRRPSLFGPVLFYDLLRTARRGRYVLLRCVYALLLLAILAIVYSQWSEHVQNIVRSYSPMRMRYYGPDFDLRRLQAQELARFAEAFFSVFVCTQLLAVVLLTPAYAAGAIAHERDRKTLEFLLATDLLNREIVLSKLLACILNTGMLVLTGLPILSIVQLLGGVDPNLVLGGYAITAVTIVSLASVSILISVYSKKARDAIVLSYLALLAYVMLSFLIFAAIESSRPAPRAGFMPWGPGGGFIMAPPPPPTPGPWEIALEPLLAGNPFVLVMRLRESWNNQIPLSTVLPDLLGKYALFHGALALISVTWAVRRLRIVALGLGASNRTVAVKRRSFARITGISSRMGGLWPSFHWLRPRLGRSPMLWKEISAEPGMAFNWFGKAIVAVIIFVSFAPPLWLGAIYLTEDWVIPLWVNIWGRWGGPTVRGWYNWRELPQDINIWVRVVGTIVATLTLLGVAVRAAGSITGERDRDTFDSLLTTQLEAREILYGKWAGSILSVRWAWMWLAFVWAIGVFLGGLDPVTLPWLLLIWSVYAAFFACLGLRFSITSPTTLRATLVTLAILALLCFGHWLPLMFWAADRPYYASGDDMFSWIIGVQAYGLTPPMALGWFAFHSDSVGGAAMWGGHWTGPSAIVVLVGIVIGMCIWGLAANWLRVTNRKLLSRQTGRRISGVPLQWTDPWGERPGSGPVTSRLSEQGVSP
jgi:ABC-type transport system involved in multi-copper enzyme maturation permease subunit